MIYEREKMIKVITFGVFDYFHYGHLNLFKQAKRYGNYLIVAVQIDEAIKKRKPTHVLRYFYPIRKELISNLRIVDEVVPYSNIEDDISHIDFDVLAIGEDQSHDGFQKAIKWCEENGKKIVHLKRTPNISSTDIKNELS